MTPFIQAWEKVGFLAKEGERPISMMAFVYSKEDIDRYFIAIHALSPGDKAFWATCLLRKFKKV